MRGKVNPGGVQVNPLFFLGKLLLYGWPEGGEMRRHGPRLLLVCAAASPRTVLYEKQSPYRSTCRNPPPIRGR
jgi:hypothetical protein